MIENLLSTITFENLILYFKDQSLLWDEKKLGPALKKRDGNEFFKVSDSDLLKKILPEELSSKMFGQGNMTLLAFVFALRHKLTLLNLLFHISALKIKGKDIQSAFTKENNSLFFQLHELYSEYEKELLPEFWGNQNRIPVIGFSAVGCLFSWQETYACRAFDHYEFCGCENLAENIFCEKHQNEIFWLPDFSKEASTQATMFRFYIDKNNFKEFDEQSLKKLLENFFYKYSGFKNNFNGSFKNSENLVIKTVLEFYQFADKSELKKFGIVELRRRFLDKAKKYHPDAGGSQELFREARKNYEFLRELL